MKCLLNDVLKQVDRARSRMYAREQGRGSVLGSSASATGSSGSETRGPSAAAPLPSASCWRSAVPCPAPALLPTLAPPARCGAWSPSSFASSSGIVRAVAWPRALQRWCTRHATRRHMVDRSWVAIVRPVARDVSNLDRKKSDPRGHFMPYAGHGARRWVEPPPSRSSRSRLRPDLPRRGEPSYCLGLSVMPLRVGRWRATRRRSLHRGEGMRSWRRKP